MDGYDGVQRWHPMYAVVGKFIRAISHLEVWLYFALGEMTGQPYVDVEDHGISTAIDKLLKEAKNLPEPTRSQFRAGLTWAKEAAALRNAVVHGVWLHDEDKDLWQSQRPKQLRLTADQKAGRTEAERREHPWIHRTFTADELTDAATRATGLSGFIQVELSRVLPEVEERADPE
jgi:hypothetical protein